VIPFFFSSNNFCRLTPFLFRSLYCLALFAFFPLAHHRSNCSYSGTVGISLSILNIVSPLSINLFYYIFSSSLGCCCVYDPPPCCFFDQFSPHLTSFNRRSRISVDSVACPFPIFHHFPPAKPFSAHDPCLTPSGTSLFPSSAETKPSDPSLSPIP